MELHGSAALLDDLRILPMQTSFLVFLHPRNLFLEPTTSRAGENFLRRKRKKGSKVLHLFLARLSLSASPVGAKASAVVISSSMACRLFT